MACYQCLGQNPPSLIVGECISAYGICSLYIWKGTINGQRFRMTYFSGKASHVSARQCKAAYSNAL